MNKSELAQAMAIANDKSIRFIDDDGKHLEDIGIFDGFGLADFKPVYCTLRQVAFLIRWQCFCMDGSMDANNFNDLCNIGRTKFIVTDADLEIEVAKKFLEQNGYEVLLRT